MAAPVASPTEPRRHPAGRLPLPPATVCGGRCPMHKDARRLLAAMAMATCLVSVGACSRSGAQAGGTASLGTNPSAPTTGPAGGGPDGGGPDGGGPTGGTGGGGGSGGGGGITFPSDAGAYTKAAVAAWASKDVSTLDQYEDSA